MARAAADLLRTRFGATRVVLFGSLADRERFRLNSDIDLAAWGVDGMAFYAAVAGLMDLAGHFKIDLVDPQTVNASLRDEVERQGVVLWSRPT